MASQLGSADLPPHRPRTARSRSPRASKRAAATRAVPTASGPGGIHTRRTARRPQSAITVGVDIRGTFIYNPYYIVQPDREERAPMQAGAAGFWRDSDGAWRERLSRPQHEVRLLSDVPVPMRDGVELSADVYLPSEPGRWPVILHRTPYGNSEDTGEPFSGVGSALYFARRGYAVVLQDARGRFDSGGEWYPWTSEVNDGGDSVDWCGTQSWSTGDVGMFGLSYPGVVQWWAAQAHSPYLKTIIPASAHADIYFYGMNYRGGAFKLAGNLAWSLATSGRTNQPAKSLYHTTVDGREEIYNWQAVFAHLPILTSDAAASGRAIEFYRDWVRHSSYDDYWQAISNFGTYGEIDIPILQIVGWFDVHIVSEIANLEGIQADGTPLARQHHKLVIGPWVHGAPQRELGEIDFGASSVVDMLELQLRWFDRWLKLIDNGIDDEPPLKLFTLGSNEWKTADTWPLPETRWTRFYLDSAGHANSADGDGTLGVDEPIAEDSSDSFTYQPTDPVPTLGENPWDDRPVDYRAVERREDVLVYTSAALTQSLEVTGPIQAYIFASSSAVDTDWTVRVLDVQPDDRSINLCDGILRARFREPAAVRTGVRTPGQFERPQLLEPDCVYAFVIECGATSVVFGVGHRIRVHISSSNFPRFDRNLNNGGDLGIDERIVVARQCVYHDRKRPSYIELPEIPL